MAPSVAGMLLTCPMVVVALSTAAAVVVMVTPPAVVVGSPAIVVGPTVVGDIVVVGVSATTCACKRLDS